MLRNMTVDFETDGFPTDRESYVIFADNFGIPVSTTEVEERNTEMELEGLEKFMSLANGLSGIPAGISPELDTFR